MDLPLLAAAQELVFLGAALAVALLLAFQLRLAQRVRTMDLEVQRLKRAHKDGTLDARSRLEEASKALEALEESVTPQLAALEPHLADVGSRLDELEERVAALLPALEAAGRRETESSEVLADAQTRLEQAEEAAQGVGERFGVLEEGVRDTQGRLEQSEHGLDHLRTALEERLEDLDRRVAELGPIPAAAPREPTRAALGLADRRETGTRPGREGGAEDPASEPAGADVAADRQEDMGTGMRGVLLVVIGLAALTMLLRWMGVGR